MSLSQIEEKYINTTLSYLYEEIFIYRKKMEKGQGNSRDRAIWTALYIKAMRDYNFALGTLGLVGTSNLARGQKPMSDRRLRELGYEFLSDEDIQEIITETWGISKLEREVKRYELQKKKATAFVVTHQLSKKVQEAVEVLVKHGAVDKLIPLDKLMQTKTIDKDKMPNLPRGNPRKAGLVSKYMAQGKSQQEANEMADLDIEFDPQGSAESKISDFILDEEMQAAIDSVNASMGNIKQERENKKGQELLDILNTKET